MADRGDHHDRDERRDVPNFYWAQEDYLKARQPGRAWSWSVLRPGLVIGEAMVAPVSRESTMAAPPGAFMK